MTTTSPPLACTVRHCGLPLHHGGAVWRCQRGHAFDVARRGYVNLLQPQDRRSLTAGDALEVVQARARLADAGLGAALHAEILERIDSRLAPGDVPIVAELGCGTGHLLHTLRQHRPMTGVGIDLSTAAIELAAQRDQAIHWVVANADRRLPLLDGSVAVLLSVHARRNAGEAARVVPPGGCCIVAVPAEDDLIELRESIQGQGVERDRVAPLIEDFTSGFEVVASSTVRIRQLWAASNLRDLLRMTYRGARRSAAERLEALEQLEVTVASDVVTFRRRDP